MATTVALPHPISPREDAGPKPSEPLPPELRSWLAAIADLLIPSSATMPAATEVDVSGRQLDVVLKARPDVVRDLLRAWSVTLGLKADEAVDIVPELDTAAWDAVRLVVAGGYYAHPRVCELLGYDGQQPRAAEIAGDIDLDLLERVMARGPRYRPA